MFAVLLYVFGTTLKWKLKYLLRGQLVRSIGVKLMMFPPYSEFRFKDISCSPAMLALASYSRYQ